MACPVQEAFLECIARLWKQRKDITPEYNVVLLSPELLQPMGSLGARYDVPSELSTWRFTQLSGN